MELNTAVVDDGDLISHAASHMGYEWNHTCDIVSHLSTNVSHYRGEFTVGDNPYDHGDDLCNIVTAFMDFHGLDKFYYVGHT